MDNWIEHSFKQYGKYLRCRRPRFSRLARGKLLHGGGSNGRTLRARGYWRRVNVRGRLPTPGGAATLCCYCGAGLLGCRYRLRCRQDGRQYNRCGRRLRLLQQQLQLRWRQAQHLLLLLHHQLLQGCRWGRAAGLSRRILQQVQLLLQQVLKLKQGLLVLLLGLRLGGCRARGGARRPLLLLFLLCSCPAFGCTAG